MPGRILVWNGTPIDMGTTAIERRSSKASFSGIDPLAVSITDAVRISGLSRSEIYRRAAVGDLEIVKNGGRSLVIVESIRRFLAGLPRAQLRAPKVPA